MLCGDSMLKQDLARVMQRHLRPDEARVLSLRFGLQDGVARTIRQVRRHPNGARCVLSLTPVCCTSAASVSVTPIATSPLRRIQRLPSRTQVGEEMGIPYATTKHVLFSALSKMRKPHVALALRDYLAGTEMDDVG